MLRSTLLTFLAVFCAAGSSPRAAEKLPLPQGPVVLTISGKIAETNVGGQADFDMEMLKALGVSAVATRSEVSESPQRFEGIRLRAILDRVGAEGSTIRASALNDYVSLIPFEDLQFEPILAFQVDGRALTIRDKGPLWIIYPRDDHRVLDDTRYDSRWVWQLNKLQIEGP
jgi:hypothetical protein